MQMTFRKPSVLKFPSEIIPSSKMKINARKPWETTQQTAARSQSSLMMRNKSASSIIKPRFSIVNPELLKSRTASSRTQRKQIGQF